MTNTPLNADQLNRLQAIGESFHAYDEISKLCWATADWINQLCAVEDCVVYVRLGNILTQLAAFGVKKRDESIVNRIGLPLGTGIAGAVGLSASAEYVPDITKDERYIFDEFQGRSEFAVPIVHHGEVLGVIDSEHRKVDGISARDRQFMQALATLIAPHLAALLRLKQGTAPDYADVIADLTRLPAITQGNLESACATITERAARTLRVGRATIWLFKDDEHDLICIDNYDLKNNEHASGQTLARDQHQNYFAALASERVIIANDARNDVRTKELSTYLRDADIFSLMNAPIRQDGRVVGVLGLEATGAKREWNSDEASFVGTLSDFATIALVSREKSLVQGALVQSQKMESLGRLAGGISHDFNNLLTVITGAVDTLQQDTQRSASDKKLLHLIQEAGERARKLTRNLLAFGGNQLLRLEPTNAAALLASVQDLTESIIREDIKVEFEEPTDTVWLKCDATQIEQVILNLMINSIDAMPNGGLLSVYIAAQGDRHVRISVKDSGSGMSESVRQKIFEPFFTTKGELGTGLGLSISLGIIRQHSGTIECRSIHNRGTQFDVVLPRADVPPATHQSDNDFDTSAESAATQNVLLVEDEIGVRNVVTEMVNALGYTAIVADNAAHALEIINLGGVDLLLCDIIMPDMRGPDLYRAALERVPRLPALFVSGYSEDVISEIPTRDNRVGYLGKPFTMMQLGDAIQAVVSR